MPFLHCSQHLRRLQKYHKLNTEGLIVYFEKMTVQRNKLVDKMMKN